MARRKEISVTNSVALASGVQYFPLEDASNFSDLDRREVLPFRNFKVENKSGVSISVLLDPVGGTANISFTVPDGQTIQSQADDNFKFYELAIINDGAIDAEIGELKTSLRNY